MLAKQMAAIYGRQPDGFHQSWLYKWRQQTQEPPLNLCKGKPVATLLKVAGIRMLLLGGKPPQALNYATARRWN